MYVFIEKGYGKGYFYKPLMPSFSTFKIRDLWGDILIFSFL